MKKKLAQIWEFILSAIAFYFIIVTLANAFGADNKQAFIYANIITIFVGICIIYYFFKGDK